MQKEPILLIMAAGMGSRYGGLKQMDPVGSCGEAILHYSLFDAHRAGFRRVIFLIKHEIEADFKRLISPAIEQAMEVRYAFQQVDMLPAPFTVPEGRIKPWGTGHAVLCCAGLIDAPFAVINADDYYGPSAFQTAYDSLIRLTDDDKQRFMMVGYHLRNTLTDNGHVARGVCEVDKDGYLLSVTERTHIISSCDGALYTEDGQTYRLLPEDALVSMNMWGFTPDYFDYSEAYFKEFLSDKKNMENLKAEFFIPLMVNKLINEKTATVKVLDTTSKWFGVTYAADRDSVVARIQSLIDEGVYPSHLF